MVSRQGFSRLGKAYPWFVIVAGFIVVVASIRDLSP